MSKPVTANRGREGVALILALFAVVILTALAVTLASVARTDVLLAGNRAAMIQAFYAAQSGLNYCRTALADDDPAVDSAVDEWAQVQDNPPALDIPGFTVGAVIEDESARLNINTAIKSMFMALPGMSEEAADSILDWRDADEQPRPAGAESDYYLSLASPYEAANGPFQTIDELRLVRGVDTQMFEGDGTDALPGLRNLVTVRSGERNVDRRGQRRLNFTAASAPQLALRLRDLLTPAEVAAVERRVRQGPRLRSWSDLMSVPGVAWRRMAQALDRLSADDRAFIEGTVNINTADEQVLAAVGLGADIAQEVIERRQTQPFETKGDLAQLPGMNREGMAVLADRIATKSSVFRVRATAQADGRAIRSEVVALLDRSSAAPRIIRWWQDPGAPATGVQGQVNES